MAVPNWKALATDIANSMNCPVPIVLATVEAETSGTNITGDSGRALGYGQVWPSQWPDAFQYACNKYGEQWPSDLPSQTTLVLGNDNISMTAAVYVIKQLWNNSGGDWTTFTSHYVGPAEVNNPSLASDYQRRLNIWQKYNNPQYASYTDPSTPSAGNNPAPSQPVATDNVTQNFPKTNNFVTSPPMATGQILYGRRYRVIVANNNGIAFDVSKMRCTFRARKNFNASLNTLDVSIYNLNPQTENQLLNIGDRLILEAGYEGNQYGLIFDGNIVWVNREKIDGTTYVLTLSALDGASYASNAIVNYSLAKGQSARSIIQSIGAQASIPNEISQIPSTFDNATLTRGKALFGLAHDYLHQIAQSQKAQYYLEDGKINLVKMDDLPNGTIYSLSPDSGLVGAPAQNEDGVTFRSLLNPNFTVGKQVYIYNPLIRQSNFQPGQVIRSLDNDGIYRIIDAVFTGDTRGNEWYVECSCVTQAGILPAAPQSSPSAPPPNPPAQNPIGQA